MITGLIGGTGKRKIKLVDYDAAWAKKFEMHARSSPTYAAAPPLLIEHFGSTSVLGLAAKPIIDILGTTLSSSCPRSSR